MFVCKTGTRFQTISTISEIEIVNIEITIFLAAILKENSSTRDFLIYMYILIMYRY